MSEGKHTELPDRGLPEPRTTVLALLEGTSHHTGDHIGWARKGWAILVRFEEGTPGTVHDGWCASRWDMAMKEIDADYGEVVWWASLNEIMQAVNSHEALKEALREAQAVLAGLTEPAAIRATTTINAWAQAVAVEQKCRAVLAKAEEA